MEARPGFGGPSSPSPQSPRVSPSGSLQGWNSEVPESQTPRIPEPQSPSQAPVTWVPSPAHSPGEGSKAADKRGPSPAATRHFWWSCKAIISRGSGRVGGGTRGCKVPLERKQSPEAEGICRFMTQAARSLRRSRLLPSLPCPPPLQPAPTVGSCLQGQLRPLVGSPPEGGSSSSCPWAPLQLSVLGSGAKLTLAQIWVPQIFLL